LPSFPFGESLIFSLYLEMGLLRYASIFGLRDQLAM